jgi:hypothetical protein
VSLLPGATSRLLILLAADEKQGESLLIFKRLATIFKLYFSQFCLSLGLLLPTKVLGLSIFCFLPLHISPEAISLGCPTA